MPAVVCDVAVRTETGESTRGAPERELIFEDVDNDVLGLEFDAARDNLPALPRGTMLLRSDNGGGFFMFGR